MGNGRDPVLVKFDSLDNYTRLLRVSIETFAGPLGRTAFYLIGDIESELSELKKLVLEPETVSIPVETYDTLKQELE